MFDGECCRSSTDLLVAVRDSGKTVLFENRLRHKFDVVRFDDCVVPRGSLAADFIVREADVGTVIVELKGGDSVHGARQIYATADHCKKNGIEMGKMAGLVFGRQKPAAARAFLKLNREFYRDHKGFIRASSRPRQSVATILDYKRDI